MSENSYLYKLKMALFDNGEPEEFLSFLQNFNMTLEASGTRNDGVKIQWFYTLVHGYELRQFDALSAELEISIPETLFYIILGLGTYFSPLNALTNKKRAMRRGMRKPRGLKVIFYAARLIELNEYLYVFLGEKIGNKFFVTELDEILLNSMANSWRNQDYVQVFYCEYIT